MSDEGVSELLGYAVLAGMVITAVVCIASGAGGAIISAAESAGLSEASLAIRSFATTASNVARANNTYYTASEVVVPPGYELIALDGIDDATRFTLSCGNQEIFSAGTGSVRLRSPFRSVVYENGAVFCNDSGMVTVIRKPSIFIAGREGRSLYIFLTAISADSRVIAGGRAVILGVRSAYGENVIQPVEGPITVDVTSACPDGWSAIFREAGFSVKQEGNKVKASAGGISDVCIECTTLQVRFE